MTRLRSAVNQNQRPVAALLCDPDPHGPWMRIDYLLVDAYYTMDREVCGICNNPVWLCHSTDNRIEFKASVRTCYAKAEIEDFEKSNKGKDLSAGEYVVARPIGLDDGRGNFEPLPNRREAFSRVPTE